MRGRVVAAVVFAVLAAVILFTVFALTPTMFVEDLEVEGFREDDGALAADVFDGQHTKVAGIYVRPSFSEDSWSIPLLVSIWHVEGSSLDSISIVFRGDSPFEVALKNPQSYPWPAMEFHVTQDGRGVIFRVPDLGFQGRGTLTLDFYLLPTSLESLGLEMNFEITMHRDRVLPLARMRAKAVIDRSIALTTITGEYLPIGNPCTTKPCLPGIVYAVLADDECYYLTVEGSWIWENRAWDGYTPNERDHVKVTGYVSKRLDVNGDPFYEIEVVSLNPASIDRVYPTPEEVRDTVTRYIRDHHPETARLIGDIEWSGGDITPPDLEGRATYEYLGDGWNVTISWPVIAKPTYEVSAEYRSATEDLWIFWRGTVDQTGAVAEKIKGSHQRVGSVRDAVMNYIRENHPETAALINDLVWSVTPPEPIPGWTEYQFIGDGWNVTIGYVVYYDITYEVAAENQQEGIAWTGTVYDGVVRETSYEKV